MSDVLTTFESSLDGLDVATTRTDADGFAEALDDAIREPAVGVPLGLDDVSLADTAVTVDPTATEFETARTGVTPVGAGIATYGSLAVAADAAGSEPVSLYPERHVAVLREEELHADMDEAFAWLGEEFAAGRDSYVFATGASATADMGEMVEGVHGPAEVHVVVLER
ncbi:LUD domain-containing protein [Halococcus qingdaonensis]|uniref:LUD domain-containing protein n=1 Tax=Halococcus qingdaonensis TaxID=224402 RepID=UPI00211600CE|nr:LUD domain-containing protein [Halococcus qingdaonensis]